MTGIDSTNGVFEGECQHSRSSLQPSDSSMDLTRLMTDQMKSLNKEQSELVFECVMS